MCIDIQLSCQLALSQARKALPFEAACEAYAVQKKIVHLSCMIYTQREKLLFLLKTRIWIVIIFVTTSTDLYRFLKSFFLKQITLMFICVRVHM